MEWQGNVEKSVEKLQYQHLKQNEVESRTMNPACRLRVNAFEMICYRKMLRILWVKQRTNSSIIQPKEHLLITTADIKFLDHVLQKNLSFRIKYRKREEEVDSQSVINITNLSVTNSWRQQKTEIHGLHNKSFTIKNSTMIKEKNKILKQKRLEENEKKNRAKKI